MGIWDYISSTANTLNQYTLIPARNLCSTSYSYGRSAIIGAVPELSNDEDARSNAVQFATTCAKNAAVFVCSEGLKTIPGGRPIYNIVSQSVGDSKKKDQHKKPELKAPSKALEDQEKKIKEISDLVVKALEDQEKKIKEISDLVVKMREEINTLKQVEVDEQDINSLKPKLRPVSRI